MPCPNLAALHGLPAHPSTAKSSEHQACGDLAWKGKTGDRDSIVGLKCLFVFRLVGSLVCCALFTLDMLNPIDFFQSDDKMGNNQAQMDIILRIYTFDTVVPKNA